jgi:hypothetical protein
MSVQEAPDRRACIDEVPDQMVGDLAEVLAGQDGVGELVQNVGVYVFDCVDQLIESDRIADRSRPRGGFCHVVNSWLTTWVRQP